MNNTTIPQLPDTYFICLRQDLVLLCQRCEKRKEKSRSSVHCKALILSILDHWTYDNQQKGKSLAIHITIPQWIDLMYGMFGRNVIMDSLEELCMEGWIERTPFKPITGGKEQYRYTLKSKQIARAIGTLKFQRCPIEDSGKITVDSGNFNHQGFNFNVATVNNQPSPAQSTLKFQPLIEDIDTNIETKQEEREENNDDPPPSSHPDVSPLSSNSHENVSQGEVTIPTASVGVSPANSGDTSPVNPPAEQSSQVSSQADVHAAEGGVIDPPASVGVSFSSNLGGDSASIMHRSAVLGTDTQPLSPDLLIVAPMHTTASTVQEKIPDAQDHTKSMVETQTVISNATAEVSGVTQANDSTTTTPVTPTIDANPANFNEKPSVGKKQGNGSRKQASGKNEAQMTLIDAPLSEPDMSGLWTAEKVVQYAEFHNDKRYPDKQRAVQIEAARSLHRDDENLTLEQFKRAYDECCRDGWWRGNVGDLHVKHMSGKIKNSGVTRLYAMLRKAEQNKKVIQFKPRVEESKPALSNDQIAGLAEKAVRMANAENHDISVTINDSAIVILWNTPYFEKPETFTSEECFLQSFAEMREIWQDQLKKKKAVI